MGVYWEEQVNRAEKLILRIKSSGWNLRLNHNGVDVVLLIKQKKKKGT